MPATFENDFIPAFHSKEIEAVRLLFATHYASLVEYARQLINDPAEAEEMVVCTFMKLMDMRHQFRAVADIDAFLLVTVRNAAYEYLSCVKMEHAGREELFSLAALFEPDKARPFPSFTAGMLLILHDGILQLPASGAAVFRQFFYNKLSVEAVASQLKMSPEMVGAYQAQAVSQLKASLSHHLTVTASPG